MKKYYIYFLFLVVFTIASCDLSQEEETIPSHLVLHYVYPENNSSIDVLNTIFNVVIVNRLNLNRQFELYACFKGSDGSCIESKDKLIFTEKFEKGYYCFSFPKDKYNQISSPVQVIFRVKYLANGIYKTIDPTFHYHDYTTNSTIYDNITYILNP